MVHLDVTMLLQYDQFCRIHPNVMALYHDDGAYIVLHDTCTLPVSSVCRLVSPPVTIMTYSQFRMAALNFQVLKSCCNDYNNIVSYCSINFSGICSICQ